MRRNIIGVLFAAFLLCSFSLGKSVVFAKEAFDIRALSDIWGMSNAQLKRSIDILLQKIDEITGESNLLRKELASLQATLEEARKETERLMREPSRFNKLIEEKNSQGILIKKKIQDLQNETAVLDKKNASLGQALTALENEQKPRESQIAELKTKAMSLSLDLEKLKSSKEDEAQQLKSQIALLTESLAEKKKNIDDARNMITKETSKLPALQNEIQNLKNENKKLQSELSEANNSKTVYLKNLEAARNKKEESPDEALSKKTAYAQELKDKIKQLQGAIEGKKASQGESLESSALSDTKTMEHLNSLKSENESLHSKISQLTQDIDAAKKEMAITQDLLIMAKRLRKEIMPDSMLTEEEEEMVQIKNIAEAMGYAYAKQGIYNVAIEKYHQALNEDGNKRNIYFNLGYIHYKMGNVPEAMSSYKKTLKIDPKDQEAKRNLEKLRADFSSALDERK